MASLLKFTPNFPYPDWVNKIPNSEPSPIDSIYAIPTTQNAQNWAACCFSHYRQDELYAHPQDTWIISMGDLFPDLAGFENTAGFASASAVFVKEWDTGNTINSFVVATETISINPRLRFCIKGSSINNNSAVRVSFVIDGSVINAPASYRDDYSTDVDFISDIAAKISSISTPDFNPTANYQGVGDDWCITVQESAVTTGGGLCRLEAVTTIEDNNDGCDGGCSFDDPSTPCANVIDLPSTDDNCGASTYLNYAAIEFRDICINNIEKPFCTLVEQESNGSFHTKKYLRFDFNSFLPTTNYKGCIYFEITSNALVTDFPRKSQKINVGDACQTAIVRYYNWGENQAQQMRVPIEFIGASINFDTEMQRVTRRGKLQNKVIKSYREIEQNFETYWMSFYSIKAISSILSRENVQIFYPFEDTIYQPFAANRDTGNNFVLKSFDVEREPRGYPSGNFYKASGTMLQKNIDRMINNC